MTRPARANRLMVEAAAAGLSYAMLLWWLGVCALASFRPRLLPSPYWPELSWLRSDTSGVLAFVLTAVGLVTSEYLRLSRRVSRPASTRDRLVDRPSVLLVVAAAETAALLSTGLVAYISVNAITHPQTLSIRAIHLAPWPTEGTLRIIALIACGASVMALRYLVAGGPIWGSTQRRARPPAAIDGHGNDPIGGSFAAASGSPSGSS
jgi:uncharacterized membrane protein (DUF485 family)